MIHVQVLVDCSGDDGSERSPEMAFSNKKSALLQLVEGSPVAKSILFCNKVRWNLSFWMAYRVHGDCGLSHTFLTFFVGKREHRVL